MKSSETGIALGRWHLYIRQLEEWMGGYISKDWKDMRAAPHWSRSRREQCSWWLKGHLVYWEERNRHNRSEIWMCGSPHTSRVRTLGGCGGGWGREALQKSVDHTITVIQGTDGSRRGSGDTSWIHLEEE